MTDAYDAYVQCLAAADEDGAIDIAGGLLHSGHDAEAVLLDLVAPAQRQVGEWWQRNEWSIAQEHAATHISERVVAALAAATPRRAATRGRVVVACLDGEWHALPARIVAEVLRLRGWSVTFLGASVPVAHLVTYVHQQDVDAAALSCALSTRLPAAHLAVQAARRADVPIIVGGRGFGPDGRWARAIGASWAPDATGAAALLDDRAALRRPPPATLAHLGDDEYAGLTKRRGDLVDEAAAELARRFPPMRDYSPAQLDATLTDLTHIVDFLAAAVYVDDPELFTGFLAWTAEVLQSRGVPATSLKIPLHRYRTLLYDFPRAGRMLAAGLAQLP
ncbi:cobalamin B12-binding domain-containing protein [Dactylosporangium vinaceum]|uniref:B12-binding domain-containing protein n=1 Tax=Dactylosporangium vinaceum TaxID=53362 RepID=A0ABV5M8G0_9ACTN|nr:cobalamin-dependent protein [Dactylosporangium vinaceum]UAB94226.1 cobalamin B12-binding domain-containing protein [Dactylosporangium vinaceum]